MPLRSQYREVLPWLTVISWPYDGTLTNGMPDQATNQQMRALDAVLSAMERPETCSGFVRTLARGAPMKIRSSCALARKLGSATAHRLHALANSEVAKVDDAEPMASLDSLRNVGVLTKLANESSHIALNLLAANKDRIKAMDEPGQQALSLAVSFAAPPSAPATPSTPTDA